MSTPFESELAELQRWMLAVVTDEGGVRAGAASERALAAGGGEPVAIEAVVQDLPDLAAHESLAVYAGMYFERLIGALEEDYPAVRDHLGRAAWRALARRFVARHPSTHRSLNDYGFEFHAFVATEAEHGAFLSELARLELSIRQAFRTPDVPVFSADDLLAVPQERWPEQPLPLVPSLSLFAFDHPVERCYRAWRHGETPEWPAPEPTYTVCWRNPEGVWRRVITREQHALLSALAADRTLGDAVDEAASLDGADVEALAAGLSDWFRDWCSEGFFRGHGS